VVSGSISNFGHGTGVECHDVTLLVRSSVPLFLLNRPCISIGPSLPVLSGPVHVTHVHAI
jgi:hypothetical protein